MLKAEIKLFDFQTKSNFDILPIIQIIVVFILGFSFTVSAQERGPDIIFKNISVKEGLSSNYVSDIVEDKAGFIWIATSDGLCRYDSKDNFKIFHKGDELRLESSNIRTIVSDSENKLWIGTRLGGVTCYNQNERISETYIHDPKDPTTISNDEVLSILEDSKGRIWVGTENGLNLFHPETKTFTRWHYTKDNHKGLPAKAVLLIKEDSRGLIWIGTWAGGLSLLLNSDNKDPSTYSFRNFKLNQSVASDNVWSMAEDQQNRLWVGTHGGGLFQVLIPLDASNDPSKQDWKLSHFNFSMENTPSLSSNSMDGLVVDDKNNLWTATTDGLNFLGNDQLKHNFTNQTKIYFTDYKRNTNDSNSIIGSVTNNIYKDSQNNFWVGTISGLSKFNINPKQIDFIPLDFKEDLNQLNKNYVIENDSIIWLSGLKGGVYKIDIATREIISQKINNIPNITRYFTLAKDKDNLVFGTNLGVIEYNPKTQDSKFYPAPNTLITKTNGLFSRLLFIDDEGLVYIATEFGLITLDRNTGKFKLNKHDDTDPTSLSDNSINEIFQASDRSIWIATYAGLNKVKTKNNGELTFKSFFNAEKDGEHSIGSNQITCFQEVDGVLYIGNTSGLSQIELTTEKITNLYKQFNKSYILSLETDNKGNIWYSSTDGITRFNIDSETFRNYDFDDGIVENTFRLIASSSSEKYMYFASHYGISRINKSKKFEAIPSPATYITEANLINKKGQTEINLLGVEELTLSPNNYYLALKFVGLDYNRMEKTKFAYKLEGFDEEWFYPRNNVPAVYTNLKPGEYIFKAKTANNEGVWTDNIAELIVIKEAAFVEKPWVRVMFLLGILFLLYWLISLYTSNIKKNNQRLQSFNDSLNNEIHERMKIEEDLTKTNKDLQQFAYGASHDLQEPLRNIGNAVGLLQRKNEFDDKSNEYVEIAVDGVKRMSSLIENLLNYAKSGSQSAIIDEADLNKIVSDKVKDLSQLIAKSKAVVLVNQLPNIHCEVNQIGIVFYNLINNGIKFNNNENPSILVNCEEEEKFWLFSVKDNGIGIAKEYQNKIFAIFTRLENRSNYEGTGIGLSLCQKIITRHNGKIWVESIEGEGSTFYFTIDKYITQEKPQTKQNFNTIS